MHAVVKLPLTSLLVSTKIIRSAFVASILTAVLISTTSACDPWDVLAIYTKNAPPPFAPEGVTAHRDLVFVERDERDLKLDIYLPEFPGPQGDDVNTPQSLPLVVYVHGGGYFMSNRHSVGGETAVWSLLQQGYAVATMDYRFSSEAIFPAQILDVTAAACWLKSHADEFAFDVERVAFAGQSAGAHLASLAAVLDDNSPLLDQSCAGDPLRARAVVDLFGPMDYSDFEPEDSPLFHKIEQLFGGDLAENVALVDSASVLTKIDSATPPFWIAHGSADEFVPYEQSEKLVAALDDNRTTFVTIEGAGHGGEEFLTPELAAQVLTFVDTHLQPRDGQN